MLSAAGAARFTQLGRGRRAVLSLNGFYSVIKIIVCSFVFAEPLVLCNYNEHTALGRGQTKSFSFTRTILGMRFDRTSGSTTE